MASTCPRLRVRAQTRFAGGVQRRRPVQSRRVVCPAVSEEFRKAIDTYIVEHKVLAFIKGTTDFPQCGFSNTVVEILKRMGVPFKTVDILSNEMLRSGMKEYSQWPTFPQVYIDGEFYGGCDIMLEAYKDGTLKEELERVMME
eukprot:jgi/Ulvmu1/11591/UM079_0035.1